MPAHIAHAFVSPSFSAFLAHKRLLQHETSSLISKRQPGSLTTTSASLCYHLPRVYQLDTRTHGKYMKSPNTGGGVAEPVRMTPGGLSAAGPGVVISY